jgi:hypothetical protein
MAPGVSYNNIVEFGWADIPRLEGEVDNTIALYEDRLELINMTDMILNNILKLIISDPLS